MPFEMMPQKPPAPTEKPKIEFPAAELDAFFARQWKGLLDWLKAPEFLKFLWDECEYIFTRTIGLILRACGYAGAYLAKTLLTSEELMDPALDELASVALKDLLGVEVQIGGVGKPGQAGSRTHVYTNMGQAVLGSLFGDYTGATARELQPGSEGASRFLTTVTRLSFEGWLKGWVAELFSAGQLETFGDLDDILVQSLGLGRLSRRVMAPPLSILVEQPFTWLLNQTFRPTRLGSGELIRQYLRGRTTREELFAEHALMGYRDPDTEALLATHQRFLSDTDVRFLIDRGVWTEAIGLQHLQDAGYSPELAKTTIALEQERVSETYRRQAAGIVTDAYAARDIEVDSVRRQLSLLGFPQWEQDWMRMIAEYRREFSFRNLSLGDTEQAVKRGIVGIGDFRSACYKLGYSPDDARTLELLLMTDISDKAAADKVKAEIAAAKALEQKAKAEEQAARRREIEAELAVKEISLPQIEALVRRGLRTVEQYRQALRAAKYAADDVNALAELLEGQIDDARAEAERREELRAEAAKRKLSLSDLERAVKLNFMSVEEYRSQLAGAGFSDNDRGLLAGMLQRELDLAIENEARKVEAARRLAERQVSLDDLERAVRLGQRSVDQYRARLTQEGFLPDDADLMADLLRADLAADQEARERRAEIDAKLKRKKISLGELEQAVRAGVRTMPDYRNVLVREGYSDEDAELLVRLLQLQIDADRQAADKRKEAEATLAERHIALSDVERAVKLGVLDMAAYKRVLTREGFIAEDQTTLVTLLTTEISGIRDAERKRAEAEKAAAKRNITLADIERAVRLGLRTLVEYQGVLASLGYAAQDQSTLVSLLQLQIAQDQAAQLKRQEAETALAPRSLSLSQFERAVVEGLRSSLEYRAWLREQGFGEEDAATLVALLQLDLAARAQRERPQ
jgi:hypothetical protein